MKRMLDMEDFPVGTRVATPTGRIGTVIKHRGAESKLDHFQRVTVRLDGGSRHNVVTLQPHLLAKYPAPAETGENNREMKVVLPFPPKDLSPNARLHWAQLSRAKKAYRHACWVLAKEAGLDAREAAGASAVDVHLAFYPPDRRPRDGDNMLAAMKAGLDGLADALGIDDRAFRVTFDVAQEVGGMVKVTVTPRSQEE